jgi:hypothetical protein
MYETKLGFFPADSVFFAIEVKSSITAAELRDSLRKAETLRALRYTTGMYQELDGRRTEGWFPLYPVLFAFRSDLSDDGKTEIERYKELDRHAGTNPLIHMICVIGKGFGGFVDHLMRRPDGCSTHRPNAMTKSSISPQLR